MMRLPITFTVTFLAALCAPAWAINKCTGADGKVAFQDAACEGKGQTISVRPASGSVNATQPSASPGENTAGKPKTESQRLEVLIADSQRDRRKRDLQERLFPNAQADIANHKTSCQETQAKLEQSQYAYEQNLYGKTHAAQKASEMAAAAAKCDTKDRELRENLEALRKECLALGGCK